MRSRSRCSCSGSPRPTLDVVLRASDTLNDASFPFPLPTPVSDVATSIRLALKAPSRIRSQDYGLMPIGIRFPMTRIHIPATVNAHVRASKSECTTRRSAKRRVLGTRKSRMALIVVPSADASMPGNAKKSTQLRYSARFHAKAATTIATAMIARGPAGKSRNSA
jgi:hypothetical protein